MAYSGSSIHKSVLVNEVLEYLNPHPKGIYIDATFGSGGHTRAILDAQPKCKVIALDWDAQALETFGDPLQEEYGNRLQLIWGNFAHLYKILRKEKITQIDGILADFGTSQVQIKEAPGFSIYEDMPLDMRMSAAHARMTAAEIINTFSEKELRDIFFYFGEERASKSIAHAIILERQKRLFTSTHQLASFIEKIMPWQLKKRGIHPATKVFQALRIYVNQEIAQIEAFLPAAFSSLKEGGRLVCISFHSLEDRVVKQFFLQKQHDAVAEIVTKKAVIASEEEIHKNPSARSAKLRAVVKTVLP